MSQLEQKLRQTAEEFVDQEIERLANEHFRYVVLPNLKRSLREKLVISLLSDADTAGISLSVEFKPFVFKVPSESNVDPILSVGNVGDRR